MNLNSSLESSLNRLTTNERLCTRGGAASVNLVTQILKQPAKILQIPAGMSKLDADWNGTEITAAWCPWCTNTPTPAPNLKIPKS